MKATNQAVQAGPATLCVLCEAIFRATPREMFAQILHTEARRTGTPPGICPRCLHNLIGATRGL